MSIVALPTNMPYSNINGHKVPASTAVSCNTVLMKISVIDISISHAELEKFIVVIEVPNNSSTVIYEMGIGSMKRNGRYRLKNAQMIAVPNSIFSIQLMSQATTLPIGAVNIDIIY